MAESKIKLFTWSLAGKTSCTAPICTVVLGRSFWHKAPQSKARLCSSLLPFLPAFPHFFACFFSCSGDSPWSFNGTRLQIQLFGCCPADCELQTSHQGLGSISTPGSGWTDVQITWFYFSGLKNHKTSAILVLEGAVPPSLAQSFIVRMRNKSGNVGVI